MQGSSPKLFFPSPHLIDIRVSVVKNALMTQPQTLISSLGQEWHGRARKMAGQHLWFTQSRGKKDVVVNTETHIPQAPFDLSVEIYFTSTVGARQRVREKFGDLSQLCYNSLRWL